MKSSAQRKIFLEEDSTTSISPIEGRLRYKEELLSSDLSEREELSNGQAKRMEVLKMFERTTQPSKALFREKEYELVLEFARKTIDGKIKSRCMIVTGMPGAGKTLICTRALSSMDKTKLVVLNANTCRELKRFLVLLESQLYSKAKTTYGSEPVKDLLNRLLEEPLKQPALILVDEFDELFSKVDEALLAIFELFTHPRSKLTLVGTSNSMEFIEKVSHKFKSTIPQIKNIVFSPYSSEQFEAILMLRMKDIEKQTGVKLNFQERSLRYISCKMYNAKGGDVRKVLIEVEKIVKSVLQKQAQMKKEYSITIEDVAKVASEIVPTKRNIELMRTLALQQQLVLLALYTSFKEGDILNIELSEFTKQCKWVTASLSIDTIRQSDIKQKLEMLQSYSFVALKPVKNKLLITIKLLMVDVEEAFEEHPLFGRFFQP